MQVPIGATGWYLCDWDDVPPPDWEEFSGRDALAVQWLNQFQGDVFAVRELRRLLGATHPWSSDEQVFADAAVRLASGVWKARRAALPSIPSGWTS
jgi:hypothetical protein